MKPDWKDAPRWALWLALDRDGWYWFASEPVWGDGEWVLNSRDFPGWTLLATPPPKMRLVTAEEAKSSLEPRP